MVVWISFLLPYLELFFLMALLGQMHGSFLLYLDVLLLLLLCILTFEGCISVKINKISSI